MSEAPVKAALDTEETIPEVTAAQTLNHPQQVQDVASVAPAQPPVTTATEDEDESEDESEILEESPCGRWQKRREEVRSCVMCANLFLNRNVVMRLNLFV